MPNFQKQQDGFALIGLLIAVVIIVVLFIYSDNTFFSRENDIKENKAIYEEAKKDLDEIEQKNQQLNDLRNKMMEDSENIEQVYNEREDYK
ncbi:prepilin-type N-terminal cleavage/methylation domain-containing protein [Candidatus Parcubacteria bacterium]|nr:prepilin-type N-terminal cleavage/methylation domain-containing protein [Candidatus Parcubacteria bacterium]